MPLNLTREQTQKLADGIEKQLSDLRPVFRDFRASRFREIQWRHAKSGWGGVGSNSPKTDKARRKRWGYYKKPQRGGVRGPAPAFVWTGRVNDATARFTKITKDGAVVDPTQNYGHSDVARVEHVLDSIEARGGDIWHFDAVDEEVSRLLAKHVARVARGKGGR